MNKRAYIFFLIAVFNLCLLKAQIKPLNFLPDTFGICSGDSVLIKFPEDKISKTASYEWITPKIIIYHTKQIYAKHLGLYIVKINDGKKTYGDTTYIKLHEKPKLRIKDTTICNEKNILIIPKNKYYKYTWSTNETSDNITIDKPGKYWVKINNKGCAVIDTFSVKISNGITPNFGKEMLICENETNKTLSVKANNEVKLFWSNGSNSPAITINKEGWYWVKSISKSCGTKTDSVYVKYKNCDCEIFIPNSFTPNDDDRNDYFSPVFQCDYSYFALTIFDRWGNTVYATTNINTRWDGRFKGNPCPDDIYVYKLEAIQKNNDKKIVRTGHISLFR